MSPRGSRNSVITVYGKRRRTSLIPTIAIEAPRPPRPVRVPPDRLGRDGTGLQDRSRRHVSMTLAGIDDRGGSRTHLSIGPEEKISKLARYISIHIFLFICAYISMLQIYLLPKRVARRVISQMNLSSAVSEKRRSEMAVAPGKKLCRRARIAIRAANNSLIILPTNLALPSFKRSCMGATSINRASRKTDKLLSNVMYCFYIYRLLQRIVKANSHNITFD